MAKAFPNAFTLVELLVVISVMAIVGVFTFTNLGDFGEDQKLKSATQDVQSLIKQAQANASSKVKCQAAYNATWQVVFSTNRQTVTLGCQESGAFYGKRVLDLSKVDPNIQVQSIARAGFACPADAGFPGTVFAINFDLLTGTMNLGEPKCSSFTVSLENRRTAAIKSVSMTSGGTLLTRPSCDTSGSQLNGLVGYWDFNEGSGTVAQDKSGFGHAGTWSTASWDPNGKIGSAGQFSGSNYVSLGTNALGSMSGPFTISAWIKTSSTANQAVISEYEGNTCGAAIFFIAPSSNEIGFHDGGSYTSKSVNTDINLADNQWHHIVYVYTVTDGKIYLDGSEKTTDRYTPSSGVLVSSPGGTSWQNLCTAQQVRIGATSIRNTTTNLVTNDRLFNGLIDEVRIYNRALTDAEITASYNGNKGCSLF